MRKTIYLVKMAINGADKLAYLYFETRPAATEFYESHDYCNKPVAVRTTARRAAELINMSVL